jgi:hypothetical protein
MLEGEYLKNGKIDTTEEGIVYWANKINCAPHDLRNAVMCIGDDYKVLKLYLELNRLIKEE